MNFKPRDVMQGRRAFSKRAGKMINRISFWLSLLAVLSVIYDFGFNQSAFVQRVLHWTYLGAFFSGVTSLASRYLFKGHFPRFLARIFDIVLFLFLVILLIHNFWWGTIPALYERPWVYVAVFLVFLREFSAIELDIYKKYLNPAQLFIASFLAIIIIGTSLLILPKATHSGISVIDALFTSTSAVCVTGLIVVDTGTYFTSFGKSVILFLIQAGGIGIMTFTSYFSYFFRGSSSYENQLLLKDMVNSEKIGEVFSTLKKIILLTFIIEAVGTGIIFFSLDARLISSTSERVFFSVFHSISAFCNAGFSTLENSLYAPGFRFNYPLHMIIAFLFIIGGIGFPIAFNFFKFLKHIFIERLLRRKGNYIPWLININTRLVLITTGALLLSGTLLFYLFEYNNTLAEHRGLGKVIAAFFGASTPRTAGFNSVDMSALNLSTLMVVFLLMWVGASPGSTGGGIKTTSFAIGTLNFISIARGKDRIEVFRREVSEMSVKRAFAVISLSLIVIGISVFLIAVFDPDKELLAIAFESFSAYSTVGLSLGVTGNLSAQSKLVIIITMFIGRVGMLTILTAFLRRMKPFKYRYPSEDILIN
jgi:trk system potassium uptake protein TrkH